MSKVETRLMRLEISVAVLAMALIVIIIYLLLPSFLVSFKPVTVGQRLTGIDTPLTPSQLSTINNASNNYFEMAGEKLLNLSIPNVSYSNHTYAGSLFEVSFAEPLSYNALIVNGKPSVIYIGAISCVYCGENRWAMALALSRFGTFNTLYTGYSSLGDGDVPTLYWNINNYTAKGVKFGNSYKSNYINFFSAEYESPITAGFQFPASQYPIQYFAANATNSSYVKAMNYMNRSNAFQGTPFTLWGTYLNRGADAVVLTNSSNPASQVTNYPPISYMSHAQIFNQLQSLNDTFALEEYAAADVYIAQVCPSINNTAPICSLPAIKAMEKELSTA